MDERDQLEALRRMAELQARANVSNPDDALPATLPFGPFDTHIPIPKSLSAALVGAGRTIDRQVEGAKQPFLSGDAAARQKTTQDENTRFYDPLTKEHPVATFLGEVAPALAAGGPVGMAAFGANEYGTPGERALRAGAGFVGGKLGQGVARMFGPESMRAAPTLASEFFENSGNKWGIPTTMAQNSTSKPVQIAESVVANLPFGGAVNKARNESFQGFNRAVSNTFGENSTKITPELLGGARDKVGGEIGKLAERNTWGADPEFATQFARLTQEANSELVGDALAKFNKYANIVEKKVTTGEGSMPGTQYRKLRTAINTAVKDSADGDTRRYLGSLKEIVESTMDRSIPHADQEAWKVANRQYFNLNQVADATKATPGDLGVAALLQSVNRSQRAAKFGGGNDLAEIAQWAKKTLPDKIPNSGTAQRAWYQALLTNPVAAGGGLLGVGAGANALDIDPRYAAGGLLPLLASRAMAGKPVSEATKRMLMSLGGAGLLQPF